MMADDPDTYYITDHYLNYEWMLVRLSRLRADALPDLLAMACRAVRPTSAARKKRKRP